jgi:hypothetical protein
MNHHLIAMEELPESLSSYSKHIEIHALHVIADEHAGGASFIYANVLLLKSRIKNRQRGALALLACESTRKPMLPNEPGAEEFLERNFGLFFRQPELLIEAVQISNYSTDGVLEKISGLVRSKRLKAMLGAPHCILIPEGVMEVASVGTSPVRVWTPTSARSTANENHFIQPIGGSNVRHLPSHEVQPRKAA